MSGFIDPRPDYWAEYSNLQKVKHDLIRHYLSGWFPKLGLWAGKIIYLDTHAGRGRHEGGEQGSPLVALHTLFGHRSRAKILSRSRAIFYFVERDKHNAEQLLREVKSLEPLQSRVEVHVQAGDCFTLLSALVSNLRQRDQSLAPAFVFVDPYGFKVPGQVLKDLMQFQRVELFLNLIWRELDMAIAQGRSEPTGGMASTLNQIFNSEEWATRISSADFDERSFQATSLLQEMVGARWATSIRMLGRNEVTRYLLLHFTNHDAGRDLMKDCVWKVCPDGGYYASKSIDPTQQLLITPTPDLRPLRAWIIESLLAGPKRWSELEKGLLATIWRRTHFSQSVLQLIREDEIEATDYSGRLSRKSNPILRIAKLGSRE